MSIYECVKTVEQQTQQRLVRVLDPTKLQLRKTTEVVVNAKEPREYNIQKTRAGL